MEYVHLGRAGVKVSRLCLGTGFRAERDEETCLRAIEVAIDRGCNFIDCANNYGYGRSEQIVGKALQGRRDQIVLTSKVATRMGEGPNDGGLSRKHIMSSVEQSLQRLGTDYLDFYLLHFVDRGTPLEETLTTLNDLVRQGKVRYIGCCNFHGWQVVRGLWLSDSRGLEPFVCLQNEYSLLRREPVESDLMPVCQEFGLGLMTYSPLAVGLLTGQLRRGQAPPEGSPWAHWPERLDRIMSEPVDHVIQILVDLAGARAVTPAQMAIAWILDHQEVTAPILGPDLPEHVEEAFGALEIELIAEERERLDEASASVPPRRERRRAEASRGAHAARRSAG